MRCKGACSSRSISVLVKPPIKINSDLLSMCSCVQDHRALIVHCETGFSNNKISVVHHYEGSVWEQLAFWVRLLLPLMVFSPRFFFVCFLLPCFSRFAPGLLESIGDAWNHWLEWGSVTVVRQNFVVVVLTTLRRAGAVVMAISDCVWSHDERHEPAESIDRGCEVCVAGHQHTSPQGPVCR